MTTPPDNTPDTPETEAKASAAHGLIVAGTRAAAVRHLARWFSYGHLKTVRLRKVSARLADTAQEMVDELPDSPELSAGLRKLLEAKDCFVRASLDVLDEYWRDVTGDTPGEV